MRFMRCITTYGQNRGLRSRSPLSLLGAQALEPQLAALNNVVPPMLFRLLAPLLLRIHLSPAIPLSLIVLTICSTGSLVGVRQVGLIVDWLDSHRFSPRVL